MGGETWAASPFESVFGVGLGRGLWGGWGITGGARVGTGALVGFSSDLAGVGIGVETVGVAAGDEAADGGAGLRVFLAALFVRFGAGLEVGAFFLGMEREDFEERTEAEPDVLIQKKSKSS